jgi:hypothetical protein
MLRRKRMIGKALLAFIAAPTLLASTLQFGPSLTLADLRPGEPEQVERVFNAWAENGETVAIVSRNLRGRWEAGRRTIRRDGTADPAAFVPLPIPQSAFNAAPFRNGMLAAWSVAGGIVAAPLDRNGTLLAQPLPIPIGISASSFPIVCNDTRCMIDGRVIVDGRGSVVKMLGGAGVATAGTDGFLVAFSNRVDLLDNDGAVKSSHAGGAYAAAFDGDRYVALPKQTTAAGDLALVAVDASNGVWSAPAPVVPRDAVVGSTVNATLVWNGANYLLSMLLSPASNPAGATSLVTSRISHSFAPIDAQPRKQGSDIPWLSAIRFAAAPEGFRLLWSNEGSRLRTALLGASDGTIAPSLPAGQPVLRDVASQIASAAAAGRSAILGVYIENDGDHVRLRAARVGRDGVRLDAAPLALDADGVFSPVAAASDGDQFLIVWKATRGFGTPAGTLFGTIVGVTGSARTFTIDNNVPWQSVYLSVEYINGAFQVALGGNDTKLYTVGGDGTVLLRASIAVAATAAMFDGKHVLATWSDGTGFWTASADVPGGTVLRANVLRVFPPTSYERAALLRNGQGYVALLPYFDGTTTANRYQRWLVHLTRDGFVENVDASAVISSGPSTTLAGLVRVDGVPHATYSEGIVRDAADGNPNMLAIVPFNAATLDNTAPMQLGDELYGNLVAGWAGEGLLIVDAGVPAASGSASQMTVRVAHVVPSRHHSVGR